MCLIPLIAIMKYIRMFVSSYDQPFTRNGSVVEHIFILDTLNIAMPELEFTDLPMTPQGRDTER